LKTLAEILNAPFSTTHRAIQMETARPLNTK